MSLLVFDPHYQTELPSHTSKHTAAVAYVDASHDLTGRAGMAVLIAWGDGTETRYTVSNAHRTSMDAEVAAIQEAAFRLQAANVKEATIYTDCLGAVNKVNSPYQIIWIPRGQNQAADALSKLARTTWDRKGHRTIANPTPITVVGRHAKSIHHAPAESTMPPSWHSTNQQVPVIGQSPQSPSGIDFAAKLQQIPPLSIEALYHSLTEIDRKVFLSFIRAHAQWLHKEKEKFYYREGDNSYYHASKGNRKRINQRISNLAEESAKIAASRQQSLVDQLANLLIHDEDGFSSLDKLREKITDKQQETWDAVGTGNPVLARIVRDGLILNGDYLCHLHSLDKATLTTLAASWGAVPPRTKMMMTTYLDKYFRRVDGQQEHAVAVVTVVKGKVRPPTVWYVPLSKAEIKAVAVLVNQARAEKTAEKASKKNAEIEAIEAAVRSYTLTRQAKKWAVLKPIKGMAPAVLDKLMGKGEVVSHWPYPHDYLDEAITRGLLHVYPSGARQWFVIEEVESLVQDRTKMEPVLNAKILIRETEVEKLLGLSHDRFHHILRAEKVQIFSESFHGRYGKYSMDVMTRGDALRLIAKYTTICKS